MNRQSKPSRNPKLIIESGPTSGNYLNVYLKRVFVLVIAVNSGFIQIKASRIFSNFLLPFMKDIVHKILHNYT